MMNLDSALASVLLDLDRCEHGRHSKASCDGCGGQSTGNLMLPPGKRIGTSRSGGAIVVPSNVERYVPMAWYTPAGAQKVPEIYERLDELEVKLTAARLEMAGEHSEQQHWAFCHAEQAIWDDYLDLKDAHDMCHEVGCRTAAESFADGKCAEHKVAQG